MAASLHLRFSSFCSCLRKNLVNNIAVGSLSWSKRCYSQDSSEDSPKGPPPDDSSSLRDPFPLFAQPDVQSLLTRMTGFDLVKLAGPQLKPLEKPSYLILTDKELEERQTEARERLQYRLQMPPMMNPRKPVTAPLVEDPALEGHDTSKYVFVDITFGLKDRKRSVVVREPDGSLWEAPWDVKDRMNQIYHPREGRNAIMPAMFKEAALERLISKGQYQYTLDRACCQFEPDDPDYIRVTRRVYSAVDSAKTYNVLRSTRHFGPMAFYLAWNKMIDSLLLDMLNRDLDADAQDLVHLYSILHPESECAGRLSSSQHSDASTVITAYIETDSQMKDQLQLALQAFDDAQRAKVNKGQESSS